jgi:hypothetical protein
VVSVPTRIGVHDLAALLDLIPTQCTSRAEVAARLTRKADVLDELADASGDQALTYDARVLAAQARRAARDLTTSVAAIGGIHATDMTTAASACGATASGRPQ